MGEELPLDPAGGSAWPTVAVAAENCFDSGRRDGRGRRSCCRRVGFRDLRRSACGRRLRILLLCPGRRWPPPEPACSRSTGEASGLSSAMAPASVDRRPTESCPCAVTVAGMETVEVDDRQSKYPAHVVSFDPKANVAVLEVPGLPGRPTGIRCTRDAPGDAILVVLGYSDGGDVATSTARIRAVLLKGPNTHADTVAASVHPQRTCR